MAKEEAERAALIKAIRQNRWGGGGLSRPDGGAEGREHAPRATFGSANASVENKKSKKRASWRKEQGNDREIKKKNGGGDT